MRWREPEQGIVKAAMGGKKNPGLEITFISNVFFFFFCCISVFQVVISVYLNSIKMPDKLTFSLVFRVGS